MLQISLTFGFMIATCVQMFGHVSGGHMNPAVTMAMAAMLAISPSRALLYIIAQCTGAVAGSFILKGYVCLGMCTSNYHSIVEKEIYMHFVWQTGGLAKVNIHTH